MRYREIISALVVSTTLAITLPDPVFAEGRLTVTGEGAVSMVPDIATVTVGVTTQAADAAGALDQNSAATQAVLDQITAFGIAPRDAQTSGLSLSPLWNNGASETAPRITGYQANNQITIRIRDLSKLGLVLDDVVSSGANTFNGLSFGLSDPKPAADDARKAAVAEARARAALLAEAAGLTLGPILELYESGGAIPGPRPMADMARMSAVPIAEGEVSVNASVTIVYEIAK